MRQNGIFYSGDKFHPFPLRSIDFFQIPCDTENFLFQKLLLLKKFFYARKIPRFFRKYFCVFLNLFLAHRLRLNFWFFLRTRNATKRQRRQDNGNDNWIFPQTYTVAKKHRDQYAKRLQDRAKPATPPRQPVTQNFVRTLTTDSVFGYRTEKLKNAFYEMICLHPNLDLKPYSELFPAAP